MTVADALRALPYGFDEADLPPKADERDITAPVRSVNIIHIMKYISVVNSNDQDQTRGVQRIAHEQRCAPEEAARGKLKGWLPWSSIFPAHDGPQGQWQGMIVSAKVSSIPLRR
ncbi:hypothetical protein MesoLj113b_55280 [Mesorhizobium sp. 113-3-3]|nr:hypothetical protein MesoLj113b_55280 [Mesorhizobium sp. 113-3-3]